MKCSFYYKLSIIGIVNMSSAAVQSSTRAGAAIWLSPLLLCSGHCSPAHTIPLGLLYTLYNACKKIGRKDTRFRLRILRLCIRIRAGWKEAQQEECLENASGAGHCSSVLPLSAFGQDISHLILDDLVVSSVSQLTPRKSYSLAL